MRTTIRMAAVLIAAAGAASALGAPASANPGVSAGVLSCHVASGWGFVFGSSRALNCTMTGVNRVSEQYSGQISKFGADIGYTQDGVIVWTVFAPQASVAPGALTGNYVGGTASATVGVGVGVNALVGGSNSTIMLQPLSIEGNTGLNVAAGLAAVSLTYHPQTVN